MTKQKVSEIGAEEFVWKFRILDISPLFKQVKSGAFKKVGNENDNVYVCDESDPEYESNRALAEYYINEHSEVCQIYIPEEDRLRTPSNRYAVEDGRFVLYKSSGKIENGEMVWTERGNPITESFYMILDEDVEFDNGIEKIHKWRGRIIVNENTEFKFDVDGKLFANANKMADVLSDVGGADVMFDNNNLKDIRLAMQWTSDHKSRKVSQIFGWKGKQMYRSQSSVILADGVKEVSSEVDLSDITKASNLDILPITDEEFKVVGKHIVDDLLNVHERYVVDCLFGFTFLAPIASQIVNSKKWSGGRIGLWLSGNSECGKSHTALLFQNFFGDFTGEGAVFGWGSTPLGIQDGGYYFKDALFMVDDFKIESFQKNALPQIIMILQNYPDGTSRTRFSMGSGHVEEGKPIRGSLLITGEDLLDDVASIMTRYHVIRMNKDYMNRNAYNSSGDYVGLYSGFMGRYISWLISDKVTIENLVERIEKWKGEIMDDYPGVNVNRIAQSFAYNLVGFETFCKFLAKNGFISMEKQIEMVKIHKNNLFFQVSPHIAAAKDATVGDVFVRTLTDLLNSGAVHIHTVKATGIDEVQDFKEEYIGFDDGDLDYLYFFGTQVLNAVNAAVRISTGSPLRNTKTNLMGALIEMGVMEPHKDQDGTVKTRTYNKKLYGKTQVTWKISKEALGYDGKDVLDKMDGEEEEW